MPTYTFKCKTCGSMDERVLRITHERSHIPVCCNDSMAYHIDTPPLVHWVGYEFQNQAFRSIATADRPVITSHKQKQEYMRRHDLVDANELPPPPTHEEWLQSKAEIDKSIEAITPSKEVAARMERQGLMDIVN